MRLINGKHGSFVGRMRKEKMNRVGFVALALFSAVSTAALNNHTEDGNLATEDASGMAIGSGRIVAAPPDLGNPSPDLEEARITRVELKKPPAIHVEHLEPFIGVADRHFTNFADVKFVDLHA